MIFAALLLFTSSQSDRISITELATPLKRLMSKLAEVTRQPLKVSKAMENEVVCVSVHDITPSELEAKIATATGGGWSKSEDGFYLAPNDKARSANTERAIKARAVFLQASLDELAKSLEGYKKQVEGLVKDATTQQNMIARREIPLTFLRELGVDKLAALSADSREVFSNRPTAQQYAIPEDTLNAVSAWVQDRNAALSNAAPTANSGRSRQADVPWSVAKVNVSVSRNRDGGVGTDRIKVNICLYDPQGKELNRQTIDAGWNSFGMDETEVYALDAAADGKKQVTAPEAEKPMVLSASNQRFYKAIAGAYLGDASDPDMAMSPAVRAEVHHLLLTPNENDPLSYASELLVQAAKAKNLQLVASLTDEFSFWSDQLLAAGVTPTRYLNDLDHDIDVVVDKADGWLVVSPSSFTTQPLDRDEFAKVLKRMDGKSDYALDDLIAVARLTDANYSLPLSWINQVSPGLRNGFIGEGWAMIRLFDALGPIQQAELLNKKEIPLGDLDPAAHAIAEHLVYGADDGFNGYYNGSGLKVDEPRSVTRTPESNSDLYDGIIPRDYRSEPTEVAPNGLSDQAVLTLRLRSETVISPQKVDPSIDWLNPDTIDNIAGMMAYESSPGAADDEDRRQITLHAFQNVLLGTRTFYRFRIYAGRESFAPSQAVTLQLKPDVYTLKTLPPDVQEAYDLDFSKAVEELKKPRPAGQTK